MTERNAPAPFTANGVVAHRGAFAHGPGGRNSMTAFRAAIAAGYGAFECDLCGSEDEVVVVAHGPRSNSEDGDLDLAIRTTPWAQLAEVALPGGEGLSTLTEVLTLVTAQTRTGVVLELKPAGDGSELDFAARVVELVAACGAQAWVRYISFHYPTLQRIVALDPASHCAPLEPKSPRCAASEYLGEGMKGVDFEHLAYADPERGPAEQTVAAFKAAGLGVNTWTVNDVGIMRRLIASGVDQITTDEPALLERVWAGLV